MNAYREREESDEEGDHSYMQAKHNLSSNLCVTLTKHIVRLAYSHMMDLTSTETSGPVDYLSGSLCW